MKRIKNFAIGAILTVAPFLIGVWIFGYGLDGLGVGLALWVMTVFAACWAHDHLF